MYQLLEIDQRQSILNKMQLVLINNSYIYLAYLGSQYIISEFRLQWTLKAIDIVQYTYSYLWFFVGIHKACDIYF